MPKFWDNYKTNFPFGTNRKIIVLVSQYLSTLRNVPGEDKLKNTEFHDNYVLKYINH